MRRGSQILLATAAIMSVVSANWAHIGGKIYPVYELTDGDLAAIDLRDGSVADWESLLPEPSITARQFFADPTVGDGAQYDPADLDHHTWLAWHGATSRIYLAHERVDDVYINEYAGGDLYQIWRYDSIEVMLDGDHSGGDYTGSADPNWTAEEQKLNHNRTAQMYYAIAAAPDGQILGYTGSGTWANHPPYADGGGGNTGGSPDTSVLEFYVTPFDDLQWNSPDQSVPSRLAAGNVVGFMVNVPDWDVLGTYHAFHSLQGNGVPWRFANRFVDGRLLPAPATAITNSTWARIKASFR